MWKVHRYYLGELTVNVLLTFLVLFGIVLVSLVYKGIERSQGGDLAAAAQITLLWAVDTFPHLLAVALLFGTVLTYARASHDREITALRSAGISPRTPMVPALIVGVVFSILGSYAQHNWIPDVHFMKYRVVADVFRNLVLNMRPSGDRLDLPGSGSGRGSGVMTWEVRDGDTFRDVLIYYPRHDAQPGQRLRHAQLVSASSAHFEVYPHADEIYLVLEDVRYLEQADDGMGQRNTATISIDLREITEKERRNESDKDLRSQHLMSEVMRGVHENANGARFTVHRRACFALMPFLFAPLGFCIGVFSRDRGRVLAMSFCGVPLAVFYASYVLSENLVRLVDWPPIGWLPAFVIVALGTPFCWRLLRV